MSVSSQPLGLPSFNGASLFVFIAMLASFVVESELAQFVQANLHYRHPFFLFWIVHSSFSFIFPLHLLYLKFYKRSSISASWGSLVAAITNHLGPPNAAPVFPVRQFLKLILFMTIGITIPGLLWFAAVSLAYVGDVTAIWNTNAFFAYVITIKLFGMSLETRKLLAVIMATIGVLIVVYGGSAAQSKPSADDSAHATDSATDNSPSSSVGPKPTAPLIGDLLSLIASLGYGAYQAFYKKYAALPDDPEILADSTRDYYEQITSDDDQEQQHRGLETEGTGGVHASSSDALTFAASPTPTAPPFGLHSNFITAAVGIATFVSLAPVIPILHITGIEPFALPERWLIVGCIVGISFSGAVFNSALMILLAEWGAIITSVGSLLTIILVMVADVIFGAGLEALSIWSILGSSIISISFGVLAWDMSRKAES